MSTGMSPAIPALDNTMGALLISTFISCLLFGVTIVQLYFYAGRFPDDTLWMKLLVWGICIIDAIQTCFQCHAVYYYLVTHYADSAILAYSVWSLDTITLLEAFIGSIIEIFFALRVWKLSNGALLGKVITISIILLSVIHFCFGISFTARTYLHPNYSWWPTLEWNAITGLSAAAAADILIAVSLVYLLHTRCTTLERTRTLINKLILYTIETGTLTSICAIIIVILFVSMPNNLIFVGVEFILPKLYANSFMAMLNSRASMREHEGLDEPLELRVSNGRAVQIRTSSTVWHDPPYSSTPSYQTDKSDQRVLVHEKGFGGHEV